MARIPAAELGHLTAKNCESSHWRWYAISLFSYKLTLRKIFGQQHFFRSPTPLFGLSENNLAFNKVLLARENCWPATIVASGFHRWEGQAIMLRVAFAEVLFERSAFERAQQTSLPCFFLKVKPLCGLRENNIFIEVYRRGRLSPRALSGPGPLTSAYTG